MQLKSGQPVGQGDAQAPRARGGQIAMVLAGAVAGPAAQLQQAALWNPWVYAGLAMAGVLLLVVLRKTRWAWLPCIALVAFAGVGLRAQAYQASALATELEGRDLRLTGVIASMPQRNETGQRFRFRIDSATADGAPVRVPPQVQLGWYHGLLAGTPVELQRQSPELVPGDRWEWTVRLRAPHGNMNPHGFDFELWLWEHGVQATGYVRAGPRDPVPVRGAGSWRHPVERARQAVRDAVFASVADRKTAGVLAALVVGDQNAIERADWDIFRATGVAHLMSISGLHVTMFAWAAGLLVGWLWRRSQRLCLPWPAQHAALAGGVVLATAYALFSGWGVPAQRTVWMLAAVALLRLSGRRWPWPQVWLLACAVVVSIDPWALLQPGFWLSFVAVGVLFAADTSSPPASGIASRLGAMLREQWVVTLALTPLTLLLFGQVSVVGLLANALAIPWVTLLVTPLALAGVAVPVLWQVAAVALQGLDLYLQWLAAWPFATISMPAPALWAGVAGVMGGVLLAMRLPWRVRMLGLPLLLPVLMWQAARPSPGQFELLAADIGQGNAVIVRTASHALVYDSGPRYSADSDAGHRVMVPLLRALDERVDMLMLSHRDIDHTGGAAAVLAMQPQAALVSSIEDGHELQSVRRSTRCSGGQRWTWDGVDFEVLHPPAAAYDAPAKPNTLSCVLRISTGSRTALLAGDIELAQESRLVAGDDAVKLRADLLLVPHHGSKTSSSAAFLDAVRPSMAIVQAGYRNRFGHPAAPVLERYRERHIRVIDSPRCGAARWDSSQPQTVACQREQAPRYWHHRLP